MDTTGTTSTHSRQPFRDPARVLTSLLAPIEKRCLIWLAGRMPRSINSDHLTVLALVAMVAAGGSYWLARVTPLGLLLVVLSLAANWFGDSLDGTLARVRGQQRPRYGFYVDHVVDAVGISVPLRRTGALRIYESTRGARAARGVSAGLHRGVSGDALPGHVHDELLQDWADRAAHSARRWKPCRLSAPHDGDPWAQVPALRRGRRDCGGGAGRDDDCLDRAKHARVVSSGTSSGVSDRACASSSSISLVRSGVIVQLGVLWALIHVMDYAAAAVLAVTMAVHAQLCLALALDMAGQPAGETGDGRASSHVSRSPTASSPSPATRW